jgi:hypothetical protein
VCGDARLSGSWGSHRDNPADITDITEYLYFEPATTGLSGSGSLQLTQKWRQLSEKEKTQPRSTPDSQSGRRFR